MSVIPECAIFLKECGDLQCNHQRCRERCHKGMQRKKGVSSG